jgi:hypothetical protein
MPNWTSNYLTVSGNPKQLNKFLKEVERTSTEADNHYSQSKLAFNRIIPMPDELLVGEAWYGWRNANWNTKWEARIDYETTDQWESGEVFFEFSTAWSAPIPIIEKLITSYPQLTFNFKCWEESYEFWGDFTGSKGELICNYYGEFRNCDDYNQFQLIHHSCQVCNNSVECDEANSTEQEVTCNECDKEVSQHEKELWGDTNEVKEAPDSETMLLNS